MLGLRLSEGVDLGNAGHELNTDPWQDGRRDRIERLVAQEKLHRKGDRIRVPEAALLFADGIAAELF